MPGRSQFTRRKRSIKRIRVDDRDLHSGQRRRGAEARHRRHLDRADIHLRRLGPVAGEEEIGITRLARLQSVLKRPRQAQHIAFARADIGPPELLIEPVLTRRGLHDMQQIPLEVGALSGV